MDLSAAEAEWENVEEIVPKFKGDVEDSKASKGYEETPLISWQDAL